MAIIGEIVILLFGLWLFISGACISYFCAFVSPKEIWVGLLTVVFGSTIIYLVCKYGPLTLGVN